MRALSGIHRLSDRTRSSQRRCAVRHRTKKTSLVFCNWKPLLCNPAISLSQRVKAHGMSVLSSATWLSGCWTLAKQQEDSFSSWNARLLSQMAAFRHNRRAPSPTSGKTCIVVATSWQTCIWRSQSRCTIAQSTDWQVIFCGSLTTTRSLGCSYAATWQGGDKSSMLRVK